MLEEFREKSIKQEKTNKMLSKNCHEQKREGINTNREMKKYFYISSTDLKNIARI